MVVTLGSVVRTARSRFTVASGHINPIYRIVECK
jgi:hypothetical protein